MPDDPLPASTRRQRSAVWTGLYLRLFGEADDERANETCAPTTDRTTDHAE